MPLLWHEAYSSPRTEDSSKANAKLFEVLCQEFQGLRFQWLEWFIWFGSRHAYHLPWATLVIVSDYLAHGHRILFYVTNKQTNKTVEQSRSTASISLQTSSSDILFLQQARASATSTSHSRLSIRPCPVLFMSSAQCPVPRPSDPSSQVRLIRYDRGPTWAAIPAHTPSLFAGSEMGGKPALSGVTSALSLAIQRFLHFDPGTRPVSHRPKQAASKLVGAKQEYGMRR
ncbi:hypothetical protein BKA64DRAFT_689284 [Cadophora sp. MPI-SDFR-AT-0126]|nr:hypothetical protein BKA64DRAFT_689284 [Leotiomycetes sp. MPI-SDFR-AT-0126]